MTTTESIKACSSSDAAPEGEWHARKHGGAKRRLWRKIHIGVDEQTLETRRGERAS